ncbi:MAG: magnesium transporter, partial [Deferribacteraceae bacterium]|nr:magnesium transporter [Deferribacteraceae bacterium]
MENASLRVKLENVKKLIRRNARGPMYKTLNKLHPADIAFIINHLQDIDRKRIWAFLNDRAKIGEILLAMEDNDIVDRFHEMEPKIAGEVIMEMESD